jgi:hypothetical protein
MHAAITDLDTRLDAGRATQERINTLEKRAEILAAIQAAAAQKHAAYPQYQGYWEGPQWRLGLIAKPTKTKLGLAFAAGDIILYKRHEQPRFPGDEPGKFSSAYSVRNGCMTSILAREVSDCPFTLCSPGGLLQFASHG